MCIPDEIYLEAELDHLDWLDELQLQTDSKCPWESVNGKCDVHRVGSRVEMDNVEWAMHWCCC